jgi:hypothetical protein
LAVSHPCNDQRHGTGAGEDERIGELILAHLAIGGKKRAHGGVRCSEHAGGGHREEEKADRDGQHDGKTLHGPSAKDDGA